uniref:Uncharacterized protein n=1 Tax=Hordeum vulgare subsp. vulgare TaxID=112509 RepID=A0A8I6YKJ1_HORVV
MLVIIQLAWCCNGNLPPCLSLKIISRLSAYEEYMCQFLPGPITSHDNFSQEKKKITKLNSLFHYH